MADPLSIIAGIAGIAAVSAQLANSMYIMSDKLLQAPALIQDLVSNMSLFSGILENLADILDRGKGIYQPRVLQAADDITQRMKAIHVEVKKIAKRQRGFRARMGWVFNSSKVAELLDRMEALKSAMNLVLWTIQLAMSQKSPVDSIPK